MTARNLRKDEKSDLHSIEETTINILKNNISTQNTKLYNKRHCSAIICVYFVQY